MSQRLLKFYQHQFEMDGKDFLNQGSKMKAIVAVLETIGALLPKNATPESPEPPKPANDSEMSGNPIKQPKLPSIRENKSFRDRLFGLDYHHKDVEKLARWGEWFFRMAANNDRSKGYQLVLTGQTGCGKSRIAEKVFYELQKWGVEMSLTEGWHGRFPFCAFVDWRKLSESDDSEDFEEAMRDATNARIVVIDDVGAESDRFKNGVNTSRLRTLLSECDQKWLLMTTNLSKPLFEETYDLRVADRLSAAHWCDLPNLPSYRPKLKAQHL